MAAKSKSVAVKKPQRAAIETSQSIEAQTRAFIESGGQITKINSGVSGMQSLAGSKQISLGNNKTRNT